MKKLIVIPFLLLFSYVQSQEKDKLESNGFNLQSICTTGCNYISFNETIYFPYDYDKQWQIDNLEFALKETGDFLVSGDLNIVGKDSAAILQLEFLFFDKDGETIHVFKPEKFEFFNDFGVAEPIIFSGSIPKEIALETKFADVGIKASEIVPYFTISSNCFHPCKSHKLKEAMKVFKKIK